MVAVTLILQGHAIEGERNGSFISDSLGFHLQIRLQCQPPISVQQTYTWTKDESMEIIA